jgi:hypothetical protein
VTPRLEARRGRTAPASSLFVLCCLLLAAVLFTPALPAAGSGTKLVVVATGLNNPRKLFAAPGGHLYVVEAGTGGSDKCFPPLTDPVCVGLTGSVTEIAHRSQRRVITRLLSVAGIGHQRAQGPAAVAALGTRFFVLLQDTTIDAKGRNRLGPDGRYAGALITTPRGVARPRVVADFAAYEVAHNPDRGAGRGARYGDPPLDSDPYALAPYRGGFAVADAAGNDLLWTTRRGRISTLAVFPTREVKISKTVARLIRAPAGTTSLVVQSVPSSVAVGPDGALYVGELTGVPFKPGSARIWRVVPGHRPEIYASGFTTISDLAFQGHDLLVLELAAKGLLDPTSPGALIRVRPNGSRTVVASRGLTGPTGVAVMDGEIFVTNNGLFPGSGQGPHGQVLRLEG